MNKFQKRIKVVMSSRSGPEQQVVNKNLQGAMLEKVPQGQSL